MLILRILCYNGILVTWTVVIFWPPPSLSLLYFLYLTYRCPLPRKCSFSWFVWLLLVACTILLHNRIHREDWKPRANSGPVCTLEIKIEVKVKVMLRPTVQSASPSWNKAPIWGLRPDLYYCQRAAGLLIWGVLSDERTALSFARLSQ
jgi:hypothetical protein